MFDGDDSFTWFDWQTVAGAVGGAVVLAGLVLWFADWVTRDIKKF